MTSREGPIIAVDVQAQTLFSRFRGHVSPVKVDGAVLVGESPGPEIFTCSDMDA